MTHFRTIEITDGIALLTMNSSETRTVVGFDQPSAEIEAACTQIAADQNLRAVVLAVQARLSARGSDIKNMATPSCCNASWVSPSPPS